MDIVRRIDRVNLEIRRVFDSYVHPSKEEFNNPRQDFLEHQFYQEQVIYWLRKTVDELVSLSYVIDEWKRSGSWPSSVEIDCIGVVINGKISKELHELFKPHDEFLSTINEVSNAFKHSFINTDMTIVGSEYPVVFALALNRNKLSNKKVFHQVNFARIVEGFSHLYKQVTATIRRWAGTGESGAPIPT